MMTSQPDGWTATELKQVAAGGQREPHYQPLVDLKQEATAELTA